MHKMKLINAEPLIKNMLAMKTQLRYDAIAIDDIIKALREAEQVDAISVVRCKDCRWYETSRTTHPECLLHCEIGEPDYFCASGESRTELERRINNETTNN